MAMKLFKALVALAALAAMFAGGYVVRANKRSTSVNGRRILYYVDPMHPAYKSDKPGIAPDCGMRLEPVYADEGPTPVFADAPPASVPPGSIKISPEPHQMIGVKFATVEMGGGT